VQAIKLPDKHVLHVYVDIGDRGTNDSETAAAAVVRRKNGQREKHERLRFLAQDGFRFSSCSLQRA